ncbi:MAG: filamentous hemagglutinin N-terminal domain-containing protein, partial [Cyanobacteria bacterium J06576_12]
MRSVAEAILSTPIFLISLLTAIPTQAQTVEGDSSANTTVGRNTTQQTFSIEGGTIRGQSLLHSFETFSPATWAVDFDLTDARYNDINFVISRVTGGESSLIDGTVSLSANSNPDLFLINPAGISFGANATLQLPGSFVASTAESVLFKHQTVSTANAETIPMLSVSVPTGLQMGTSSGAIAHIGTGHTLTSQPDPLFAPYRFDSSVAPSIGLRVPSNETLALVGNTLNIQGGTLTADGGHIALISLSEGDVDITQQNQPIRLAANPESTPFQNIELGQRALLDVSGTTTGGINIQGRRITLTDGATVWSQNRGSADGDDITIQATESLMLSGQLTQGAMLSSIISSTVDSG